MRRAASAAVAAAVLLAACRGSVPERDAPPDMGLAAILIGGRITVPSGGPAGEGQIRIDLESKQEGPDAEIYELPVGASDTALFRVEPGVYGLAPTRTLFGASEPELTVRVEDREFRVPFPRELMRPTYEARSRKVVVIGVLEARVEPPLPGQAPQVRVRLDDSPAARRELVQSMIRTMMDPNQSSAARESAIAWSHQLQEALVSVLAEETRRPLYQTAP
jgi:hypothetical protein